MSPTIEEQEDVRVYCVRLADDSTPMRIRADTMCYKKRVNDETRTSTYQFKRDGHRVGEIEARKVVAWWIEDLSTSTLDG